MRKNLIIFLCLLLLPIATMAQKYPAPIFRALSIMAPTITGVTLSGTSFVSGAFSGTVIGTIGVAEAGGTFAGTLSLAGTGASSFQIVGNLLETYGSVACSTYSIYIIATQAGLNNSPFSQPETITCTTVAAQDPGPSSTLYASPYYSLSGTNLYVATTGSDTTGNGTSGNPWATLAKANASAPSAGTVINVAPGTYSVGVDITHGGNAATSTGYVVYRCQTLDGCIVTDPGNQSGPGNAHGAFVFDANYVMVDGFSLQSSPAQQTYGSGFTVQNGTNHFTFTHHHLWVLNSIASGYGQSGAQMNEGEYFYLVHNQMTNNSANNSSCDNGAQGSGISIFQPIALSGYTPTADDLSNSVVGSVGNNFHQFVMWNVLNNNYIYPCGSDSDGDGFIADTWSWINVSGGSHYTGGGLVAFNVAYNNGGAGFYATNSEYVTFANNTAYNDFLDTSNNGTSRGEFDQNCCSSSANTYINNIGYGIVGSGVLTNNTSLVISTGDIIYNFDTYNNNISYCSGSPANGCPYIPQQHDFMVDAAFYAGATTGDSVTITTTGTAVPAPLNAGTTYYIAKYGQLGSTLGSIYFATTYANATSSGRASANKASTSERDNKVRLLLDGERVVVARVHGAGVPAHPCPQLGVRVPELSACRVGAEAALVGQLAVALVG